MSPLSPPAGAGPRGAKPPEPRARVRFAPRPEDDPKAARSGMRRASAFLARRSLTAHRRAWSAVFVAAAAAVALLGAFALLVGALLLSKPPVERYAAADAVIAADQEVSYTTKPWGSEPRTATADLPERARLDRSLLAKVAAADGVARAIADDTAPVTLDAGAPATARSWPAAELTAYELTRGRAPRAADEVVVADTGLPRAPRVGTVVRVQADGAPRPYRVVGLARSEHSSAPTAFVTEAELATFTKHPGTVDAIGVIAEEGVSTGRLAESLAAALPSDETPDKTPGKAPGKTSDGASDRASAAPEVLTGGDRGLAEWLGARGLRAETLELIAAITGSVVIVALLVIGTTIAQAVHQRGPETALLRAVGATPRQLRSAVGREVVRVVGAASVVGAVCAVPLGFYCRSLLDSVTLPFPTPWWLLLAAPAAAVLLVAGASRPIALLSARGITKLRPADALGAAVSAESAKPARGRTVAGLLLAVSGLSSAGIAASQTGQAAAAAASGSVASLVASVALLSPWIARVAILLLGTPLRRIGGSAGFLAAKSLSAHSRRLGAAITPIALVTAFICVQLAAGATMERTATGQAGAAVRADLVVTAPPAGLPLEAADAVRRAPGVTAATGVLHSSVVLAHKEAGDPKLTRLPVLGVSADQLTGTLDPSVSAGDLKRLTGDGTVAIGSERADDLDVSVGDTVKLRFGDGADVRLDVVAVYGRGVGLGEFLFPREALAKHVTAPRDATILVAGSTGEAVREAVAPYAGATVRAPDGDAVRAGGPRAEQDALIVIGVGVIGGFTLLAVVSTLSLISVGRRPEFRLLTMVGAGRRQLRRMLLLETGLVAGVGLVLGTVVAAVPLAALGVSLGTVPYVEPERYAALAGAVLLAAALGTLGPRGRGR
ncbi:FtsX-like permease family protein [Streptomyces sp. NPDC050504]|uniref:FtsX-like permease family protein n=1 Tax=Streptomyces sp. NPDC050504 TaxID=3365618 RepID=UPI00379FB7B1